MQYINAGYSYALVVLKYFPSFKLLFFRIVFIHLSRTIRCIYFRQNFLVFFVNFESFLMISHDVCVYLWLAVISSTSFLCCLLLFLFSFFFFLFFFFVLHLVVILFNFNFIPFDFLGNPYIHSGHVIFNCGKLLQDWFPSIVERTETSYWSSERT